LDPIIKFIGNFWEVNFIWGLKAGSAYWEKAILKRISRKGVGNPQNFRRWEGNSQSGEKNPFPKKKAPKGLI